MITEQQWKEMVFNLNNIGKEIDRKFESGELTKREKSVLKEMVREQWQIMPSLDPNADPELAKHFNKYFS